MSIRNDVVELRGLKHEAKQLRARLKAIRKQEKIVEERIRRFLELKNQQGVKYEGTAVILNQAVRRKPKSKNNRDRDAIRILSDAGCDDAAGLLEKVLEARRGTPLPSSSLKVQEY